MFWTPKINSAEIISKLINTIGYCSVLCLCASHRFRKRKQAGNALMMNVEIPNARAAVQAAPLMSNLYLKQAKLNALLATWLQSSGSTNVNKSQKLV